MGVDRKIHLQEGALQEEILQNGASRRASLQERTLQKAFLQLGAL